MRWHLEYNAHRFVYAGRGRGDDDDDGANEPSSCTFVRFRVLSFLSCDIMTPRPMSSTVNAPSSLFPYRHDFGNNDAIANFYLPSTYEDVCPFHENVIVPRYRLGRPRGDIRGIVALMELPFSSALEKKARLCAFSYHTFNIWYDRAHHSPLIQKSRQAHGE